VSVIAWYCALPAPQEALRSTFELTPLLGRRFVVIREV
jgi:hypothetical protein